MIALSQGATPDAIAGLKRRIKEKGWKVHVWGPKEIARELAPVIGGLLAWTDPSRLASTRQSVRAGSLNDRNTLADFPHAFDPLVVVVGDRRPVPPDRWQDWVAAPASAGDLAPIHLLGLGELKSVEVWPDTAVLEDLSRNGKVLREHHVLSIGSPGVNLLSRRLNQVTPFRFVIDPAAEGAMESLTERAAGAGQTRLRRLADDPANGMGALIGTHKGTGLLDLHAGRVYQGRIDQSHELGVVSVCGSPWSEDHFAIMAAGGGINGTFGAVKALAPRVRLKKLGIEEQAIRPLWPGLDWRQWHPFGGIVRHERPAPYTSAMDSRCTLEEESPPYKVRCLRAAMAEWSRTRGA